MNYLRDQMVPPFLLEHKVYMRRSPTMPAEQLQKLPYGSVVRNGVAHGLDALEPEAALIVRHHDAPLGRLVAVGVLHIIVSATVRLPNVNMDPGNRIPGRVLDRANCKHRLALGVGCHARSVRDGRRIVCVERAQDRALGRIGRFGVVDGIDEEREAENIGEEDEFL